MILSQAKCALFFTPCVPGTRFAYTSHPVLSEHINTIYNENLEARAVIQRERRAKATASTDVALPSKIIDGGYTEEEDMDRGRRLMESTSHVDLEPDDQEGIEKEMSRTRRRTLASESLGSYAVDEDVGAYAGAGLPRRMRRRRGAGLASGEAGSESGLRVEGEGEARPLQRRRRRRRRAVDPSGEDSGAGGEGAVGGVRGEGGPGSRRVRRRRPEFSGEDVGSDPHEDGEGLGVRRMARGSGTDRQGPGGSGGGPTGFPHEDDAFHTIIQWLYHKIDDTR